MKHSEVVSGVIGGSFFAIPYLALSVPFLPSLAIGAAAFAAGELVLKTNVVETLKETNLDLYHKLQKARKQNQHILDSIPVVENEELRIELNEINDTTTKIIETIEKNPDK